MLCACIDIGSNTTRVLVADVDSGRLVAVLNRRAFTRPGRELRATGALSRAKIDEVASVVAEQRRAALAAGVRAGAVRAVATAAIREASNRDELLAAVRARAGLDVDVLTGEEEARLAFLGATATLPAPPAGFVAVVDVGGGSTEIALGTVDDGVRWAASVPVGSGVLTDGAAPADPPGSGQVAAMRARAGDALEALALPRRPDLAVAVGGSAASLRRLVGEVIEPGAVERSLRLLCSAPAAAVARDCGLEEERVRLLPAGVVMLGACSASLGRPLRIGHGGLREGACLELARVV